MRNEWIKIKIMEIMHHHKGKENAITREELRNALRVYAIVINDRELRVLYTTLPICSGDPGLWLPVTSQEVQEFKAYLMAKIPPAKAHERVRRIYAFYPNLAPVNEFQQELF
jgi:hypothetical protein